MANATTGLEVRESGRALRFHTETPHLVSTGSGRLSTTVTLHPLPEGRIILGSSREADVQLSGAGVEFVHCIIENAGGSVTLHPLSGVTCVDGLPLAQAARLAQGCMLTIGRSNYLRFNNPAEAKHLKSVLPNARLSPMHYNGYPETNGQLERKPPQVPRRSPRNSGCCSDDEQINFLGKLTKFEMMARQARAANLVSPKVFPSGSLTTNVPAEQILGHSRSSSLASLGRSGSASPFQNLTNLDTGSGNTTRCREAEEQRQCSLPPTLSRTNSPNQNAIYQNVETTRIPEPLYQQSYPRNHHPPRPPQQYGWQHQYQQQQRQANSQEHIYSNDVENRNNNHQNINNGYGSTSNNDLMSRSLTCERSCDLGQFSRDFDMSQSLIVAKTTTCTELIALESKFGSNPSLPCHRRAGSCDSQTPMPTQNFGSNPSMKRIQPPSPAFNRDVSTDRSIYGRINRGPLPCPAPHNRCCSQEELPRRLPEMENRLRQEQRDQELEEKARLEEILAMCVEYERQSSREIRKPPRKHHPQQQQQLLQLQYQQQQQQKQQQQQQDSRSNMYDTLPRNKRPVVPGHSVTFAVPPSDDQHHRAPAAPTATAAATTPNNNRAPTWPGQEQQQEEQRLSNGYATLERCKSPAVDVRDDKCLENGQREAADGSDGTTTKCCPPLPEKTIKLVTHNYENFVPINGNLSIYENISSQQNGCKVATANNINNNNNSPSLPPPARKPTSDTTTTTKTTTTTTTLDKKLDVSNDDLLEAIEQLSMLSKPRNSGGFTTTAAPSGTGNGAGTAEPPITTTPKRINGYEAEEEEAEMEMEEMEYARGANEAKAKEPREKLEEDDRKKYIEFLQNERLHLLGNMDGFKRSVADIDAQEEEIHRELELEKALLSAEYESESLKLEQDENELAHVQAKLSELERDMTESSESQSQLQAEARDRVQSAQQACAKLEEELAEAKGRDDERDSDLADRLAAQAELLETEKKAFEDLEFHHLEEEASKLATREELQRHSAELSAKIESRKIQLNQLEAQRNDIKDAVTKEAKNLERQKLAHLRRLEEGRNRLRDIDDELESLAKNSVSDNNPDDKLRSPSREDFDRISRVTTDSPIVNNQGSMGRKTIESLKEIERNRQLHLAKQGSQVISDERRRVEELKRRVADEVRSQWEERKMNCTSFNSVESGEESSSYSTGPTESGSGSSDGAENGTGEKLSPGKLSEFTTPSPGPSGNSYTLLQSGNAREDRPASMETERFNGNGSGIVDETGSRPLSQTSSELDSISAVQVKHRDKPKLQRPLTRYLPIKSESLDLRYHIETAGHQLPLIHDVVVDTTSCSGYLSKMSKKFHHWNKRWFVFDRKRKTLAYHSDHNARKPRGLIYFQSIEEVYVDHMNTVKSPQPSLTFIVKTTSRLYHLMAPSPEAMRVWVDVVFTGAEGYHEFDHNS